MRPDKQKLQAQQKSGAKDQKKDALIVAYCT